MEPEFSSRGKDYPMIIKTEHWHLADETADLVPSRNYTEFFDFVLANLNLPYDYEIMKTLPETIKEIKIAHSMRGDFKERKEELRRIEEAIDKLLTEFESTYTPIFKNPFEDLNLDEILGLGELSPTDREPIKPTGRVARNASKKDLLEHGTDITELVKNGHIDDVIGRKDEIWKTMLTLARRKKANPVLVGPAGVGKTQIVYGLAHLIAKKEAGFLNDWTIIEMSTTGLVAGTKYVGELEKKMQSIITAVKKTPNVILFIDEIHTIMGTGKGEKSTLDIANILKPVLASGELKLIGATTPEEYPILIKDPAVERRFNKITVEEPTLDETTEILMGIKKNYEKYHGVTYYKAAIAIMGTLAKRYNPKRNNPDSAVDLLDYCGALAKVSETKKITKKVLMKLAADFYDIEGEVDTSPLKEHELGTKMTIGFRPQKIK